MISLLNSETSDDNVTQSEREKKKSEVKIGERAFFVQLELWGPFIIYGPFNGFFFSKKSFM